MKKICGALLLLAGAVGFSACNNGDDGYSGETVQRTLLEMKDTYEGTLHASANGKNLERTYTNITARTAQKLEISLPVDLIAAQVDNERAADRIRKIALVKVEVDLWFTNIDDGGAHFSLKPQMIATDETKQAFEQTNSSESGLTLVFSPNYVGDYVVANEALVFNLRVDDVRLDGKSVQGFKPVKFNFQSNKQREVIPSEQTKKISQLLQGNWFLNRDEVVSRNHYGDPVVEYDPQTSGYYYTFHNGRYTITYQVVKTGQNTLVSNGQYTVEVDEKTGDATLNLYTYPTASDQSKLEDTFTIYNVTTEAMQLRKQEPGREEILDFTPYFIR